MHGPSKYKNHNMKVDLAYSASHSLVSPVNEDMHWLESPENAADMHMISVAEISVKGFLVREDENHQCMS